MYVLYGSRFLFLVASCTSRFASATTDDGISEESGLFGLGNPLIGFKYLRSAISW